MKETTTGSKAKKAMEEWERLQESRKIKKIEDKDLQDTLKSKGKKSGKRNSSGKGKNKNDKDSFREIA